MCQASAHFTFMSEPEWRELDSQLPGAYALLGLGLRDLSCHLVKLPGNSDFPALIGDYTVASISDEIAIWLFGTKTHFHASITYINRFYGHLRQPLSLPCANAIRMIRVPGTVHTILNGAFRGLPNLESVTFEMDSVLTLLDGFCSCPSLGFVVLPPTLEMIGPLGFSDCRSLRQVRFAGRTESNTAYQKRFGSDSPPLPTGERKPRSCKITTISGFNQSFMDKFTVPWSVEKIDGFNGEAMNGELCVGICQVSFEQDSHLREIHGFSPPAQATITVPDSVEIIGENAFVGDVSVDGSETRSFCVLERIVFGEGSKLKRVLGIRHCPRLEPVTLYGSLEEIGDDAFTSCGSPGSEFVVTLVGSCASVKTDVSKRIIIITKTF
jgi:hypothetical protein